MQVFKVYFKIIRANLRIICIYLTVFLSVTPIFSISSTPKGEKNFNQSKTKAAFINLEEDTALIKGLKEYLSKYVNFVQVENREEKLQDSLFYREVEYIVTIPKNFTKDFLQGKAVEVSKTTVPDSASGMYVDMAINKYFNTARIYINNVPGISEGELVKEVSEATSSEVQVNLRTYGEVKKNTSVAVRYFNYLAYSLLAMLILGVSSNLMVFNEKNLKRRNLCSPLKDRSFNLQLIAANIVFGLACCGVLTLFTVILNRNNMTLGSGLLLSLNAVVFTIAALSISFLVGILIKSKNVQSAIANILSVGLSFLSGVFVPQEFLSEKTLIAASFSPAYWYVKANNVIGSLSGFGSGNLLSVMTYMLIQLGFAAAIFSVALVVSKQRRIANS